MTTTSASVLVEHLDGRGVGVTDPTPGARCQEGLDVLAVKSNGETELRPARGAPAESDERPSGSRAEGGLPALCRECSDGAMADDERGTSSAGTARRRSTSSMGFDKRGRRGSASGT